MSTTSTGPAVLQSRLLLGAGFRHGFSTREGGCSAGAFASLNLGGGVGDDAGKVEENHRLLAAAAGLDRAAFRVASQVHGSGILELEDRRKPPPGIEADAIAAFVPGLAPAVRTADCVPLLLADPDRGWAAAIHAGWRGTEARNAARAVEAFVARGATPQGLIAAIGPAIGRCCYEVSPELAERFWSSFGGEVTAGRQLDLELANQRILLEAGLREASIERLGRCTSCDRRRFFSHRRDEGRTGRHLSFIESR